MSTSKFDSVVYIFDWNFNSRLKVFKKCITLNICASTLIDILSLKCVNCHDKPWSMLQTLSWLR